MPEMKSVAHGVQIDDPSVENVFFEHSLHVSPVIAPSWGLKDPGGHGVHCAAREDWRQPSRAAYVPGGHTEHSVAPSLPENVPGGHSLHSPGGE